MKKANNEVKTEREIEVNKKVKFNVGWDIKKGNVKRNLFEEKKSGFFFEKNGKVYIRYEEDDCCPDSCTPSCCNIG
jgi:uncharacterized beta-barrel protein YwiB (DUF1934 family)